jgi:phosphatidylglycerophosphate synthase
MTENHKALPTLREIRAAHSWKRDYENYLPLSRFIFRPVGFLLTWVAIRIGLTTEAVSWFSGIVGVAACLCLVSGDTDLLAFGLALLLFFNLLDCVDGSIARTMKTENPYGRFLDSICGGIVDMAFWGIVGIMAYHHPHYLLRSEPFGYGPIFWLVLGGLTCFLFILLGYLEQTFDRLLRPGWERLNADIANTEELTMKKRSFQQLTSSQEDISITVLRKINTNLRVRETHYFLLIITLWLGIIDFLLEFYFLYYTVHTIILMIIYCFRGTKIRDNNQKNYDYHSKVTR